MSTASTPLIFQNYNVTQFRAWAQAISGMLQAVGLVQTADTGQVNLTTMTVPAIGNYAGFEIFRFNDALQASKPVFIKVEYGTGSANALQASVRFSVSNATNGAGTLSGTTTSSTTTFFLLGHHSVQDTQMQPAYCFGDTSSVALAFPTSVPSGGWRPSMFMVERTRNADGTPNGDGVAVSTVQGFGFGGAAGSYGDSYSQLLSFLAGIAAPVVRWLPIVSPGIFGFWDQAGSVGTDINLFPYLVATPKPEAQMMSLLGCYSHAFTGQTTTEVNVNGEDHTYISLGNIMYASFIPSSVAGYSGTIPYGQNFLIGSLLMRYE